MPETNRTDIVKGVLVETGCASANYDTDTIAGMVVHALDNPPEDQTFPGTGTEPDDQQPPAPTVEDQTPPADQPGVNSEPPAIASDTTVPAVEPGDTATTDPTTTGGTSSTATAADAAELDAAAEDAAQLADRLQRLAAKDDSTTPEGPQS